MNKKVLLGISLGLMIGAFVFLLISFAPAANLAMTILGIVFSAGAILCLVLAMLPKKTTSTSTQI